jgi:hypothetical protein
MNTDNKTEIKSTESNVAHRANCCKIINLGVKRDNDGLRISIQSPIDFKILKKGNTKFVLGGVNCFAPRQDRVDGIDSYFSTSQSYEFEGLPNLTMLLAESLKTGVTFSFPPMPISDKKIKEWMEQFKQDAKVLFLTFVKPIDYTVVITSQTIEKEIHD